MIGIILKPTNYGKKECAREMPAQRARLAELDQLLADAEANNHT